MAKIGDLRVYYMCNFKDMQYFPVKTVEEAIIKINTLADRDLKDDTITDNSMGLERYEDWGEGEQWAKYYDDMGCDINEIMEEAEEQAEA